MALLDTTTPGPHDGWPDDSFLSGNFAPVHDELDVADLTVTGAIPAALNGAFMRNGPNPEFAPLGAYNWFDGDGMVHAVYLEDGKARYKNRYVETVGLAHERAAGEAVYGGIENLVFPPEQIFMEQGGPIKNVANTAFALHGGKLLTLWETGNPHEIDYDLNTVGIYNYDGKLDLAMTAHPKVDPETGYMYFFGVAPMGPFLVFHVVDDKGNLIRSEPVEIPRGVMMHDFQITDKHAIFLFSPACYNLEGIAAGEPAIKWMPEIGTKIGVFELDASPDTIEWFDIDPCYGFHFMNGWADGETVSFDIALTPTFGMPDGDMIKDNTINFPKLTRFEIDLAAKSVTKTQLFDLSIEFPIVNPAVVGRKNQFGYSPAASKQDSLSFDLLAKYDLDAGTHIVHDFGSNRTGGDAMFVADPAGSAEDDGWILTMVHDGTANQTTLEILDAKDLTSVATVEMPRRVPNGFHSQWVPAAWAKK